MSLDNIKPIAIAIGAINEQIKELTKKKKEMEEEIRPVLADAGPMIFGDYQFECKTSAGRSTLDKKAVEEAGIDLSPFQKRGRPYTTLTIKTVNVV